MRRPCVLTVLLLAALPAPAPVPAQTAVLTWHNDNARDGANPAEFRLTPAAVAGPRFGKLAAYPVDGAVYAQPLYLPAVVLADGHPHPLAFVATASDSVYAFDLAAPPSSPPVWVRHLGVPVAAGDPLDCGDIYPSIGIIGTPVIDPSTGTLYLVAKTMESGTAVQRLHALDVATGAEKFGGPVAIAAAVPGTGAGAAAGADGPAVKFDPLWENQRAALLLSQGVVYIAWAGHCDKGSYHGWLLGYDAATLAPRVVFNSTPDDADGGVWQSGAGPAADAAGNIYFATGNGAFDAASGGRDWGDSLLRFAPAPAASPADSFTPSDQWQMDQNDLDLSSSGPVLLPAQAGAPPLLAQSDKQGDLFLLDRAALGGYSASANGGALQWIADAAAGLWSSPAFWNQHLYLLGSGDVGGVGGALASYPLVGATFGLQPATASGPLVGYPGATPSLSSDGDQDGVVWLIDASAFSGYQLAGGPAVLRAYDASTLAPLYDSSALAGDAAGTAVKFAVPTVADGRVLVGTAGELDVYGLRPAPLLLAPATQAVAPGDPATLTVSSPAAGTALALACVVPASGCSVNPATLAPGATATVTIASAALPPGVPATVEVAASSPDAGSNATATASAVVHVPDFSLTLSTPTLTLPAGHLSGTLSLSLAAADGFQGPVALTCAPAPGLACVLPPPDPVAVPATLAVAVSASAPGRYSVNFSAQAVGDSDDSHAAAATVVASGLRLAAVPTSVNAPGDDTAQLVVQLGGALPDPASTAALSCAPADGLRCSFAPAAVLPGQSSTLTLAGLAQLPPLAAPLPLVLTALAPDGESASATVPVVGWNFALAATSPLQPLPRGQDAVSFPVSAPPDDEAAPIALGCAPGPYVCAFQSAAVAPGGTATLTVSGLAAAPVGPVALTVVGTRAGLQHAATATLEIGDFSLASASPRLTVAHGNDAATFPVSSAAVNGLASPIALTCAIPAPARCQISPASLTPGQSAAVALTGLAAFPVGTVAFTVTGTDGADVQSLPLAVAVADFTLAPAAPAAVVRGAAQAQLGFTLAAADGLPAPDHLACSAPAPLACQANLAAPAGGTDAAGTALVTGLAQWTSAAAPIAVQIVAAIGADTKNLSLPLLLQDFSLGLPPAPVTVVRGSDAASVPITLTAINGFAGATTLACTAPAPLACAPSSASVRVTGLSQLPAGAGPQTIAVTAASGPDSHAASAQVAVQDFGLVLAPAAGTVAPGGTATFQLAAASINDYATTLQLSCAGAPAAATCAVSPSRLSLAPGATAIASVAVTTIASSAGWLWLLLPLGFGPWSRRRRHRLAGLALLVALTACGGGPAPLRQSPPRAGTPAGSSTLTITAGDGTVSHSIAVQLIVQ